MQVRRFMKMDYMIFQVLEDVSFTSLDHGPWTVEIHIVGGPR
jgi:hypothetical protein